MPENYNNDYQYNSCISRGICSVNPRTSSLQEILVLYLSLTAYYAIKLEENGRENKNVKNLILNTISIMVSNPDFSELDFNAIVMGFNEELPKIINEYENLCKELDEKPEILKSVLKYDKPTDIINSIRLGEKEYLKRVHQVPSEVSNLFKILFVLAKSICTNILDLESFGVEEGYNFILKILNTLNKDDYSIDELKEILISSAEFDNKLMKQLHSVQVEKYGEQRPKEVSYSTTPAHAVLVVGSNIRELEIILESLKSEEIDVYTHDEMMLAHTFPKFEEYPHLKGQFGQGMENCLLDFATFPGPIILTRHSLYNVENLYRGRLYTTDFAYSKGVISISNYNFSGVIKASIESKGFKTGKDCTSEIVGYDYKKSIKIISEKIQSGKYSKVFVIGLNGYTQKDREYFEKLLEICPADALVISLSCCIDRENIICLNACFDSYAMVRISEYILDNFNLPSYLFFPKCDRHTISKMIYLSSKNRAEIFVGKCTPISLNPNLIITLTKVFGIKNLTTPKKDLEEIILKK